MNTVNCDVVIVGGGVAGGTLACNLRDTGLDVVLVELNAKIPKINRGDQVAPCTVRMLAGVGAVPSFEKRGSTRVTRWKAIGPEGETIVDLPLAATAPPPHNYILSLQHSLIHEALLETAAAKPNVRIHRGWRVTRMLKDGRGAATGVEGVHRDGEAFRINARVVAGCDGPRSLIREEAAIPTEVHTYPFEYMMLTCTRHPDQDRELNLEVWGAEGFGGLFPISQEWVRCPIQETPGKLNEWRKRGLAEVQKELATRFPYFGEMKVLDDELHAFKIIRHHCETYVRDGVVLLGDAAHVTPPYYGMGMNMGMRDAYHVAKVIAAALAQGRADREALLPYEDKCRTFNQFVINASHIYGEVAAAKRKTASEIQQVLKTSTALDPGVMSVIYGDYDNPPPPTTDPTQLKRAAA